MNENGRGLLGALVTGLAGIGAGYVAGAINNPKPPVYREPEAVCKGCSHHMSFHGEDHCSASWTERILASQTDPVIETKKDKETGGDKSKTLVPASKNFDVVKLTCTCKGYIGPKPYEQIISGD